jgi:hypothetical protein
MTFTFLRTVPLSHNGDCGLLGVAPDLSFYVEEIYGDEGWMAQAAYDFEGQLLAAVDEASGDNQGVERLLKPKGLVRPRTGASNTELNYGGARHRGLVMEDRVEEMLRPLSIEDKMLLVEEGAVPSVPPPYVLGLAQSYVVSEVQLISPGEDGGPLFLLSRRLRVAYRLPEPAIDDSGETYDYDSVELSVLQRYSPHEGTLPLGESLPDEAALGVVLNWPTDIVLREGVLFAADSAQGRDDLSSRVHLWEVSPG